MQQSGLVAKAAASAERAPDLVSHGTLPQRGPVIGNQARLRMLDRRARAPLVLQRKLEVGAVDDPLEREADAVADRVMRAADAEIAVAPAPPKVSRKCAACDEEGKAQRTPGAAPILSRKCDACEEDEKARRASADSATNWDGQTAPESVHGALAAPGAPLERAARAFFEPRFGRDLADVRVHADARAAQSAREVGARAYTVGTDIVFARGAYAPATEGGRRLIAHELAHVMQQGDAKPAVQRKCSHDGTLTNCANPLLPLSGRLAGQIAHRQINGWSAIPPHSIPRATKKFMGKPSTPATNIGFADLWQNLTSVNIGEIKSTLTGSAVAGAEARHYVTRHDESTARGPAAPDDLSYLADVGPVSKTGALLDLSKMTGAGIAIGSFIGDPGKTLNVEADNLGAVVYWCTGTGTLNPAWLVALKAALDALKEKLKQLKQMMEDAIDAIVQGGKAAAKWVTDLIDKIADWGQQHRTLALLALIVILLVAIILLIISILAEPESAGTSTVPLLASLAALVRSATAILALIRLALPNLAEAVQGVAAALMPAATAQGPAAAAQAGGGHDAAATDYDPVDDTPPAAPGASPAAAPAAPGAAPGAPAAAPANPGDALIAALKPLADPQAVANAAIAAFTGGVDQQAALAAVKDGTQALRGAGDDANASDIEKRMADAGLSQPS
jgi:hypothetical protein